MARPMILIKEHALKELAELNNQGVPVLYLIRTRELDITAPTLARLIEFYNRAQELESADKTVHQIIMHSLFPSWLAKEDTDIVIQDISKYKYSGKMPLGRWEESR